jgi:hypothetical protein
MENISTSPPQKNLQNPNTAQQQMNPEVMNLLKNKGKPKQPAAVEKAKEQIRQYIIQYKLNPQTLIGAGQMAQKGLRDPVAYKMAMEMAIKYKLTTPQEVGQGINYKILGYAITIGKLTEQLVQEGI